MDLDLEKEQWSGLAVEEERRHSGRRETDNALQERQQLQADYARAVARAEQQEQQARALFAMSHSFTVTLELDDLRQSIVEALYEALLADTTSLFLREDDGHLRMVAQCNIDLTRARIVFGPDEGLVALAARERRVVHVPDTATNASYLATGYDHPRSLLAVPIEPDAGPGYVICIVRRRIYAFTDDELQFASLMGSVAGHALSNAALYYGMSTLAREHTALFELARASTMSDGLTSFIGRAVDPLRRALNATGCAIVLTPVEADDHSRDRITAHGLSPYGLRQCEAFAAELAGRRMTDDVALRCDVSPDRSRLVLAPVVARGEPIAVIAWETLIGSDDHSKGSEQQTVWDASHHLDAEPATPAPPSTRLPAPPLSDAEAAFIASVCQQLALAVDNLRLRARDLSALRSMSALPASRPHLDQLRQSIVAEVAEAFAPAAVALILRDEQSAEPRVITESTSANAAWVRAGARLAIEEGDRLLTQRRGIALAALVADRDVIGWLALRLSGTTRLSADRALVFTSLAGAAALLLRNARLYVIAREAAVDRERQRIAREMHDGVAQNLAHLMLRLELVQRLISENPAQAQSEVEGARGVLLASLNDLRQSIAALAPAQLEELGFNGAIQALLDDISTNFPGLQVELDSCPDSAIPRELCAPAFRVTQEALSNIRKHAHARHAFITIEIVSGDTLQVTVRDDGRGFALDNTGPARGHFGLSGMRERAEEFGGVLAITSAPKKGTTVSLSLPLALAA